MTDEDAFFEVWWQLHRRKTFGPDTATDKLADHPHWGEGYKEDARNGWMARASLHVTYADKPEGHE